MIDWLRDEMREPSVTVAGRTLPIVLRRHARATRLTMRLSPDGGEVRITLPRWGRTRDALVFAEARSEWIAAQLARVPAPLAIGPGASVPYRGQALTIDWSERHPRKPVLNGDTLRLGGTADSLPQRVRRWLEGEALRLFAQDLTSYCARDGRAAPDIRLSRAQRRWGSCTGERDTGRVIRINWRLVMAPDHVRRSVVAHEVAHLTHFDHSPAFHAALARLYEGDIGVADDWLKREGRRLYAAFG